MIDGFVEFVKFVGGLCGIASSVFLVYDRLFRDRPIAFLFPAEYKANLRFENVTKETIIIDKIVVTPPLVAIVNTNDMVTVSQERATRMYSSMQGEDDVPKGVLVIPKPMDQRTFPVHRVDDFDKLDGRRQIKIRCRWRNTRRPVPFPRHLTVSLTVEDIRNLREASLANKV